MNTESHAEVSQQTSDRSSLSPPPPITLRFGMKQAIPDKVHSSSSEDEGPPSKKAKTTTPKKVHPPPMDGPSSLPAENRKSYDWLQPSSAAASHRGPPERFVPKITGWTPADEFYEPREGAGKKSHKRKPDITNPGPGKAWRKGLKKSLLTLPSKMRLTNDLGECRCRGEGEDLSSVKWGTFNIA